ncbi:restriction endonuclease subunit S [Priestia aryabhattai]|uniref:restriction endonuclease subunit S n=1 Tax=Priestia aryabhattai TaxID=412384 RepID=UPI002E1BA3A1|nr:restriction endonuclease subunit S [Priestia aryabhattai]MED4006075.1 restriction endonuclease subunit S [Priestia aryabhattai]
MIETKFSLVKLEDLAIAEKYAIVDGPFGSSLKVKDYIETGIPVLQGQNITNNHFKPNGLRFVSEDKASELSRSKVKVGDILIVKIGSIGYSAEITDLGPYPYAIIPANLAKVTINEDIVCKDYLLFWLRSRVVTDYLKQNASKTAQPALSLKKIKDIPVVLPNMKTQKAIVEVLNKAQTLMNKRQAQIKSLSDLKQSVFLDIFGDPVQNNKHFKVDKLPNVLEMPFQNGLYVEKDKYTDAGEGIKMLHMSDIFNEIADVEKAKQVELTDNEIEKYGIDHNDILIARRSLNYEGAAKPCLIPETQTSVVFESSLIRLRANQNIILPIFLYYYLSNEKVRQNKVYKYITRSTISGINQKGLSQIDILVPPISKQLKFVESISNINRQKHLFELSLRHLQDNYQSLMKRAFSGELFEE